MNVGVDVAMNDRSSTLSRILGGFGMGTVLAQSMGGPARAVDSMLLIFWLRIHL